jgi:Domain of unknown function (DUF4129)
VPGRGARGGVDAGRAAAVLLLVAAAAVGLRAGGAFSAAGSGAVLGIGGHVLDWTLTAVEVILAVAGVVILVARFVWMRGGGKARERKRRSIWWLLLLPLVVFGLAKIIARLRAHGLAARLGFHTASPRGGSGAGGHLPSSPSWPVLVVFAVVVLASAALALYRRRRPRDLTFSEPAPGLDPEPLAGAVVAGEQALREEPDPRAAIIGCYAAMERSLADAGSPAEEADTPAEVLARATAGGLVRSRWAGTLTGLFRQARYSSHPMTEADRTTALGALAGVRADLGMET